MKKIISMMVASILSLFTFYSTCWYSASKHFEMLIPFVFVAIFAYILIVYIFYRTQSRSS